MAKKGSRWVEVEPGVRIWAKDIGDGQPLVLLHGWPASHQMFEYQLDVLPAHGIRCIALDTRGFGDSDRPWDGYTYDRLADDLAAVLDDFGIEHATLAGFSMGGATALRYMAKHGRRVDRLVLLGAAAPSVTQRKDFPYGIPRAGCDQLIELAYRDRPTMIDEFAKMFFHRIDALSPSFKDWFAGLCREGSGHATIKCCELFRDADLRPDLARIQVPTLILHGDSDRICTYDLAEQLHAGIKGSKLVTVDDAGHGFFYEKRDRINEELRAFMGTAAKARPVTEGAAAQP